jgi:hypothetical protein
MAYRLSRQNGLLKSAQIVSAYTSGSVWLAKKHEKSNSRQNKVFTRTQTDFPLLNSYPVFFGPGLPDGLFSNQKSNFG